jgi:hypothetical protein
MKIKKNVAISENGLLFHSETGESFSLNPIGVQIIKLLQEEKTYDEIAAAILEQYSTDAATFERDYQDFLGLLKQNGLITDHHE